MLTNLFDLVSGLYALAALYTLRELWLHRRELAGGVFTANGRRLGELVGFFFLTPVGVLAHEGAHWAVARALGAHDAAISFRLYWGYVTYSARLPPEDAWLVSAAGPLASLLIGFAALLAALRATRFLRAALASFAQATLMLVLVAYPVLSFLGLFGDFVVIYLFGGLTRALGAAAVHAVGLFLALRLLRRFEWWGPPAAEPTVADPPTPAVDARPAATQGAVARPWIAWTVATALGLVVGKLLAPTGLIAASLLVYVAAGVAGASPGGPRPDGPVGLAGYGAVVGASVGWAQYVVLQRRFSAVERWIGLSLLGGALGGAAAGAIGAALDPLIALGLGAGQALALPRTPRALLWPMLTAVALGGTIVLLSTLDPATPHPLGIPGTAADLTRLLAAGLVHGATTGPFLFRPGSDPERLPGE